MRCVITCGFLCLFAFSSLSVMAADKPPAKPTHTLQPTMLEVDKTRDTGDAWDTGIGAFTRPDPQVTLLKHDPQSLAVAAELLVKAMEKQFKELGKPLPVEFKNFYTANAMQTLQVGAAVEALQDQKLTAARAKFASDTAKMKDTFFTKLTDGGLPIGVGDRVMIVVNDIDIAAHDKMGQQELEITKEILAKEEIELKFDSVLSLRLKFIPLGK